MSSLELFMKFSLLIKSVLAATIYTTGGISRSLKRYSPHDLLILMYHRVIPGPEVKNWVQPGMYVKPGTFENHLRFLNKHFRIIGLDSSLLYFEKTSIGSVRRPSCILTFDDGWDDFYQHAFPILQAYKAPATVFLPTDFIGSRKWFWTDRLAYLLSMAAKGGELKRVLANRQHPFFRGLVIRKGSLEVLRETAISSLKSLRIEEIDAIIGELASSLRMSQDPPGRAFLTWEEVREMSESGLINFGSHTRSHSILTTLDAGEISEELSQSREKLIEEKVVDPSFVPFSYPNGDYNDTIVGLVKQAGFHIGVTTVCGWNKSTSEPYELKRVPVHQDITCTLALLGCRIIGLW